MSIFDDIYLLFYQLMDYIADLFLTFFNWITQQFQIILKFLSDLFKAIDSAIRTVLNGLRDLFNELVNALEAFLSSLISAITNAFATAWNIVRDAVNNVLAAIGSFASNLFASIKAQISAIVDQIKFVFTSFIDRIEQAVAAIVDGIVAIYNDVVSAISSGLQSVFDFVADLLTGAAAVVQDALAGLVSGPAAVFEALSTRFNDIASVFRTKLDEVVATLGQFPEEIQKTIDGMVDNLLAGLLEWSNAPQLTDMMNTLTLLSRGDGTPVHYRDFVAQVFQRLTPDTTLARGVVFILLTIIMLAGGTLSLASVYAQPLVQAVAREFPYALLAPPDVVLAVKKGLLTRGEAIDIIKRQGFSGEDADRYIKLGEGVPTEDVMLALWHRQIVSDQELSEGMEERGFTPVWREKLKDASFHIPPIGDLVVMAVREVFSPSTAAELRLFEEFPDDFGEWTEKQGLSREWAMRYWGAHWGLPSATQGFEMLHRGIINIEQLDILLKALDVAPVWRSRLRDIAYLPYTRVDIRRMHQLGVLSDADVKRAHLDLGYEEEKAERLTEFVLRLNRNAPGEDDAELGRLSRSSILDFYRDGVLPRQRATELLISLGVTSEAASLYLDSVDNDEERIDRKAETDIIIAQAEAGSITFAEAEDRLNRLGLETREIEKALTRLARSAQLRIKLPSRDDGERFFKLGLLNSAQYKDLLIRLGFASSWADMYVNAVLREATANAQQT